MEPWPRLSFGYHVLLTAHIAAWYDAIARRPILEGSLVRKDSHVPILKLGLEGSQNPVMSLKMCSKRRNHLGWTRFCSWTKL